MALATSKMLISKLEEKMLLKREREKEKRLLFMVVMVPELVNDFLGKTYSLMMLCEE